MCVVMFMGKMHSSQKYMLIRVGVYLAAYERDSLGAVGKWPSLLSELEPEALRQWFDEHPPYDHYGSPSQSLHQEFVRKLKQTCVQQIEIPVEYVRDGKPEPVLGTYVEAEVIKDENGKRKTTIIYGTGLT
jgi:Zn/Cd-binding protein ZinT